jgi:hypothetical protein
MLIRQENKIANKKFRKIEYVRKYMASIVRIKKKGTPKSDGRISVTNSVRKFPPDV